MAGKASRERRDRPGRASKSSLRRVCFVTTVPSTLEAFFMEVAGVLHDEGGCDVVVVCDESAEFAATIPDYVRYVGIPMRRGLRLSGLRALYRLVRLFRNERFCLVQYATPNASLYASIAGWVNRVPVRLYCQCGIRYVSETGLLRILLRSLEWLTCRLSTHVRVASEGNRAVGLEDHLYPPQKSYVLGKGGTVGVDLTEYPLEAKGQYRVDVRGPMNLADRFVFGFVGRISRDKGAFELFRAFRRLSETSGAVLLCVGEDETGARQTDDSHTWARSSDAVVFTGQVPKADMPKYYAAIDCLVVPTYREGFGMVIQEAAAMAVPIITTDVPGASEVMEPGESCILVPAADDAALEEAMRLIMASQELRSSLGAAARTRVELYFERSSMLTRQYDDYRRLFRECRS